MRGFTEPALSGFRLEKMMPIAWKYHCGPTGVMRLWSMICVCLLVLMAPMAARADITLTFGTYAADKPTVTVKKISPVFDVSVQSSGRGFG